MDKRLIELVADEHANRKRLVRNIVILAAAVIVGLGGILYALNEVARSQQRSERVVIDPSQLPPIRPGPQ